MQTSYTRNITTTTKILIYKTKHSSLLYSNRIYRCFANHTSTVSLTSKRIAACINNCTVTLTDANSAGCFMSFEGFAFQFLIFWFSSSYALSQNTALEMITLHLVFPENHSVWQGQYDCPFDFLL